MILSPMAPSHFHMNCIFYLIRMYGSWCSPGSGFDPGPGPCFGFLQAQVLNQLRVLVLAARFQDLVLGLVLGLVLDQVLDPGLDLELKTIFSHSEDLECQPAGWYDFQCIPSRVISDVLP